MDYSKNMNDFILVNQHQQQQFSTGNNDSNFIYQDGFGAAISTPNSATVMLPQSPPIDSTSNTNATPAGIAVNASAACATAAIITAFHTQHCFDDNATTTASNCTSPSSILSVVNISQHFPSPSLSPYQHAPENVISATSAATVAAVAVAACTPTGQLHHQLDLSSYYNSHAANVEDLFAMSNTSNYHDNLVEEEVITTNKKRRIRNDSSDSSLAEEKKQNKANSNVNAELRRQIHIQSEQKRRAQIKDGFEDLRNELPSCLNKKMSKVALLHRTVQHIQHLKNTQITILAELERLIGENEQLKKFQDNVLQKQSVSLEKMYNTSL